MLHIYYIYEELKTKRDYIEAYDEIKAWTQLENEEFDFGEGTMRIEGWYGSEDAYYKMDLKSLESYLFGSRSIGKWDVDQNHEYWENYKADYDCRCFQKKLHKSHYKQKEKQHILNLSKVSWVHAGWSEYGWDYRDGILKRTTSGYLKRYYAPRDKKILRKISNRKVRRFTKGIKNGCNYKKVFDLWWELY